MIESFFKLPNFRQVLNFRREIQIPKLTSFRLIASQVNKIQIDQRKIIKCIEQSKVLEPKFKFHTEVIFEEKRYQFKAFQTVSIPLTFQSKPTKKTAALLSGNYRIFYLNSGENLINFPIISVTLLLLIMLTMEKNYF
jgi:hypothetical protein